MPGSARHPDTLARPVNPLLRHSDRVEAQTRLAMLVVLLLTAPFLAVQSSRAAFRTADPGAGVRVSALVLRVTWGSAPGLSQEPLADVQVQDSAAGGRTDRIAVPRSVRPGDTVQLWLDPVNRLSPAPPGTLERASLAALTCLLCLALYAAALSAILWAVRRRLDRRRMQDWEDEWRMIAPIWSPR